MSHLFTYGLVRVDQFDQAPLKKTEIGEVATHWRVTPLREVVELLSGGTPSKARPDWWEGPIPWASPKDLKVPRLYDASDHISADAASAGSRVVPPGSLFIVVRGMILAKDIPISLAMVPMAFNQDMKAVIPQSEIRADYLLHAFAFFKDTLAREIGTSAHGTKRIGTSALEDLLIPLPPLSEQEEIAKALAVFDQHLVAQENRKRTHDTLFAALLQNLMKGRVRVPFEQ